MKTGRRGKDVKWAYLTTMVGPLINGRGILAAEAFPGEPQNRLSSLGRGVSIISGYEISRDCF